MRYGGPFTYILQQPTPSRGNPGGQGDALARVVLCLVEYFIDQGEQLSFLRARLRTVQDRNLDSMHPFRDKKCYIIQQGPLAMEGARGKKHEQVNVHICQITYRFPIPRLHARRSNETPRSCAPEDVPASQVSTSPRGTWPRHPEAAHSVPSLS